ncbi:MAG: hypothetical protein ACK5OX_03155 [Desertimonas sp.]
MMGAWRHGDHREIYRFDPPLDDGVHAARPGAEPDSWRARPVNAI